MSEITELLGKPVKIKGEYSHHSPQCVNHYSSPEITLSGKTGITDAIEIIRNDDHICCDTYARDKRHNRLRFIYQTEKHNIKNVSFNSRGFSYIVIPNRGKYMFNRKKIMVYAEQ
jgi:hypothetical protein